MPLLLQRQFLATAVKDAIPNIAVYDRVNTLTGCAVDAASVPIQAGHFHHNVNVYAISNFLPSSFVLDHFFWYQIVQNQILYRNMYFKSKIFNIIANNTRERTNLYENSFFLIKFIVIITGFFSLGHCK